MEFLFSPLKIILKRDSYPLKMKYKLRFINSTPMKTQGKHFAAPDNNQKIKAYDISYGAAILSLSLQGFGSKGVRSRICLSQEIIS